MTSLEIFEAQKARDRKHHTARVVWLSAERPLYEDGEPVPTWLAFNMLKQSQNCLADPTGMHGYNTGPQADAA